MQDVCFASALYGSDMCVCGQNISILNQQNDTQCDMDCDVLNPTAKCGGSDSIAVYRAGKCGLKSLISEHFNSHNSISIIEAL